MPIYKEPEWMECAAKDLYDRWNGFDPDNDPPWADVSEGDKHMYYALVETVVGTIATLHPDAKISALPKASLIQETV